MADSEAFRIGTRASALARAQTGQMADRIRGLGHRVHVEHVTTRGDTLAGVPVVGMGGDGVFVRELERALLERRIDAAVHSLKDVPTAVTPGLALACVPARATPFDVFVGRSSPTLEGLPAGAVVGTSSVRRVMSLGASRPDIVTRPIRGNVDTRLRRLDEGECDGLILAGAGLERLGLSGRVTEVLRPERFWPAVGQGALVIQVRSDDPAAAAVVAPLDDPASRAGVEAERACLERLAGGCLAPIGAWGRMESGRLVLGACVLGTRGGAVVRLGFEGAAADGEGAGDLGRRAAESLLGQGADELLSAARRAAGAVPG